MSLEMPWGNMIFRKTFLDCQAQGFTFRIRKQTEQIETSLHLHILRKRLGTHITLYSSTLRLNLVMEIAISK